MKKKKDSVLSSFKGLFSKVSENTKASLEVFAKEVIKPIQKETKQIFVPEPIPTLGPQYYLEGINIYAGLEFLQKIDSDLRTAYQNGRNNNAKAEAVSKKIVNCHHFCAGEQDHWNKFNRDLQLLPEIANGIKRAQQEINELCNRAEALEKLLDEQTEQVAELELNAWKIHQSNFTELYSRKKSNELQGAEQQMKINAFMRKQKQMEIERLKVQERISEQMIKAREQERADRLREEQILLELNKQRENLTSAFQKEMEAYKKNSGSQEKGKKKKKKKQSSISLDQVTLETESDPLLEAFLGAKTTDESTSAASNTEEDESNTDLVSNEELDYNADSPAPSAKNTDAEKKEEEKKEETTENKEDKETEAQPVA